MIIKLPVCKDENNNPVIDPEKNILIMGIFLISNILKNILKDCGINH